MHTYVTNGQQLNIPACPRSVALGLFDGLHPGHRQVILAAMQGIEDTVTRCVYTFDRATVTTKMSAGELCTPEEETALLGAMGVDELIRVDFATVRHLTPEDFVREILHRQLGAVKVTCGFNYRFGAGGSGDATLLTRLCAAYDIAVTVVPEVDVDGLPINSTAIRAAIAAGDMVLARRLLGRPYGLQVTVTEGQQLGRRLGLPTINQVLPPYLCQPKFGVYASCVQVGTAVYPAVTNIGVRPTVGANQPLAETYLLNYTGDLYGTTPTVYPLRYLREEQVFPSLEALKAQIGLDVAATEGLFAPPSDQTIRAVFFDFDDTLDNRDAAFRQGLSGFLTHYYPSLSEAERSLRQEEMFRYQRGEYGQIIYYETMIRHFLSRWPAEVPADPERALWRFYHDFAAGGVLHPDVLPTLTALRRRGYLTGIITNGRPLPQTCKMDHSGLRPYVDLMVLAGEEGVQKPDPALFHMAAARLGVSPAACLYVGDHPQNDVEGARKAGFKAVLKQADREPDHPIHRFPLPEGLPVIREIRQVLDLLEKDYS
ncbi:MAG: riboflavin biosynthesis protein RibF [Ruminococcaceae bacterium]|nr:riboflavin biosynthesis protein RibF [Oscillospiraceae bacterium]